MFSSEYILRRETVPLVPPFQTTVTGFCSALLVLADLVPIFDGQFCRCLFVTFQGTSKSNKRKRNDRKVTSTPSQILNSPSNEATRSKLLNFASPKVHFCNIIFTFRLYKNIRNDGGFAALQCYNMQYVCLTNGEFFAPGSSQERRARVHIALTDEVLGPSVV